MAQLFFSVSKILSGRRFFRKTRRRKLLSRDMRMTLSVTFARGEMLYDQLISLAHHTVARQRTIRKHFPLAATAAKNDDKITNRQHCKIVGRAFIVYAATSLAVVKSSHEPVCCACAKDEILIHAKKWVWTVADNHQSISIMLLQKHIQ